MILGVYESVCECVRKRVSEWVRALTDHRQLAIDCYQLIKCWFYISDFHCVHTMESMQATHKTPRMDLKLQWHYNWMHRNVQNGHISIVISDFLCVSFASHHLNPLTQCHLIFKIIHFDKWLSSLLFFPSLDVNPFCAQQNGKAHTETSCEKNSNKELLSFESH